MSRLEDNSIEKRKEMLSKNKFNSNSAYSTSHTAALSDGDENGKGKSGDSIGSKTDIAKRIEADAKNLYNKNEPYGISNA